MELQNNCRKGLLREVTSDPWGLPFCQIMNKLRGSSGPLTAMHGNFLDEVIAELFSRDEPFVFPTTDSSGEKVC